MISPVDIATGGYMTLLIPGYPEPEVAIATQGYIIVVVTVDGSGTKRRYRYDDPKLAQALREDQEIIEIITLLTMSDLL